MLILNSLFKCIQCFLDSKAWNIVEKEKYRQLIEENMRKTTVNDGFRTSYDVNTFNPYNNFIKTSQTE
jgi:hypothetical protein